MKYYSLHCLVCLNKVCALDCSITILCLQIPKTISEGNYIPAYTTPYQQP